METRKIGVVGLGALGEMHISDIKNQIPSAEVIAVCDIREGRVKEIQEKYDIPHGYTDYDEMLKTPGLEAVMIVTNVVAHKEQCVKAAEAGMHIFCEKPLAKTVDECREIEAAVEKNKGKIFTIGFMRRSDPAYAEAMRRVRAGDIGDVILFKSVSLDPLAALPHHLEGVKKGLYAPFFYEMGIHDADLAGWFLNSEVESVFATGGAYVEPEFAKYNDYDSACALARFKNGTSAYIEVCRIHNSSHVHAEIVGTKGTIRVNNIPNHSRLEIFNEHGFVQDELDKTFLDRWQEAYVCEIRDFIACINGEKTPEISVYDGAKSLRMANMMQKAYVEKTVVYDA